MPSNTSVDRPLLLIYNIICSIAHLSSNQVVGKSSDGNSRLIHHAIGDIISVEGICSEGVIKRSILSENEKIPPSLISISFQRT
jgi:hypothetical protein